MDSLKDIMNNPVVTVPFISWMATQTLKVIYELKKYKKISVKRFVGSGGMPSSHAAYAASLATVVGSVSGLSSVEFGISVVLATIVMYDAAGVRRAAGKQAQVLNKLIFDTQHGAKIHIEERLKELLGHTPLEVVVGAVMGVIFGLIFTA